MAYTLGISAFYHDSAAALLSDGTLVCAFQEERFTRIKQDRTFPRNAIRACLEFVGIQLGQVDDICYYESAKLKYDRIIKTYIRNFPRGISTFVREAPRYWANRQIDRMLKRKLANCFGHAPPTILHCEHHLSHAASAFYPSPFETAAILCVDGIGEWATVSAWRGRGKNLTHLWEIRFPDSLGLLYSAFTFFCGFKVDSGEYKLMGLAPYGEPRYADLIRKHLIFIGSDGSFTLNRRYFNYEVGNQMTSASFETLFDGPRRLPESSITQREMDLAASIQLVTEEVILKLAARLRAETGEINLCLAGGVALNCVANGKLVRSGLYDAIFVQPASGDAGCSLGAAYIGHYARRSSSLEPARSVDGRRDGMQGSYLGNAYSDDSIRVILDSLGACYESLDEGELIRRTSAVIAANKVVGWFQGRMEFGPRALGGRSILGNPMSKDMQRTMNLKIKNRESFRPFAPAILLEHTTKWFELPGASPYMLVVADLRPEKRLPSLENQKIRTGLDRVNDVRAEIPAIIHVDYSARIQTVDGEHNALFRRLLEQYFVDTACPILINTSFNVRGEPIVESPKDAYTCFMRTEIDYLVIGSLFLEK